MLLGKQNKRKTPRVFLFINRTAHLHLCLLPFRLLLLLLLLLLVCLFFFFKYILFIIYLRFVRQHLRCHHRPSFLVFLLRLLLLLLLLLFCLFFFRSFFFGFFLSVTVDNYESILYGDGGRRYGWKEKPQLENEKDKKKKKQIFIEK